MWVQQMITEVELKELQQHFRHEVNYAKDNPLESIDPLAYHNPEGDSCLHIAATRGDYRATELLLKAGLNIDEQGDMGQTPLHCAIAFKRVDIANLLVRYGASLAIKNEFEKTPLELAKEKGITLLQSRAKN